MLSNTYYAQNYAGIIYLHLAKDPPALALTPGLVDERVPGHTTWATAGLGVGDEAVKKGEHGGKL